MRRLEGELELLNLIRNHWPYGGTIDQLEAVFFEKIPAPISFPQLLEILVAQGEVLEVNGLYSPAPQKTDQTS